ncbi:MAG: helix-turn-helix domain-containing protein [Chitinophagaceae bacterium]|nr:helix-turn-helix domain-containing protein [Chitinophagaceae bacterium]
MITNFQIIKPDPHLENYIERIFIIESSGKLPSDDLKLIVPNACPKLVIPFKNGLIGKSKEWEYFSNENTITFIGISDIPASVDFQHNGTAGNITIEFSPLGAYRFLSLNWSEVKNRIYNYADIAQKIACELEEKLINTESIQTKINLAQQFLTNQFISHSNDPVFDYCIEQITRTKGRINITELEKYTGYSARWINMKFQDKIGLSPKNLASVIRFQQYYQSLVTNTEMFFLKKEFYNYYYDQSHFIKDFKRFTGYSPSLFAQSNNNYDKVFYKE